MRYYCCDCCNKEIMGDVTDLFVLRVEEPLFVDGSITNKDEYHLCAHCMRELDEYLSKRRAGWKINWERPVAPETETITESDVDISKEVENEQH